MPPPVEFAVMARLSPRQAEAWAALWSRRTARVLYGGAGFGGKSYFARAAAVGICLKLADHYGVRAPRVILARQTYNDLRDNHHSNFELEWGHLGKVYQNHKQYGYSFVFHNPKRGAILFRNAQDKGLARGRGKEVHAVILDESTQFTVEDFSNALYNARALAPFNPVLLLSNPDGVGFAWHRGLWRPHLPESVRLTPYLEGAPFVGLSNPLDFRFVRALPQDNPLWGEQGHVFLASVASLPPHIREARLKGLWNAPEGARWPKATEDRLSWSGRVMPAWRKVIGLDYGIRNPFAAIWLAHSPEGYWVAYRELYEKGVTARDQARKIMGASPSSESYAGVYGDPAMWAEQQRHEDDGKRPVSQIYSEEFSRDPGFSGKLVKGLTGLRTDRFATMDDLVGGFDDDEPLLKVDISACPNFWQELTGAVHPRNGVRLDGDLDKDCADHALTGVLYALHGKVQRKRSRDKVEVWDETREDRWEFFHRTGLLPGVNC